MNKAWISILERKPLNDDVYIYMYLIIKLEMKLERLHMKMKFEKIEGSAYEDNLK